MLNVAYLELPMEQRYKVKVNEQDIPFFFARDVQKEDRWLVTHISDDNIERPLKMQPKSREGCALLAAYMHFERERRGLDDSDDE